MTDTILRLGNNLLQHGMHSARVYLMKLDADDCPAILRTVDQLVRSHGYTKAFAKVPAAAREAFADEGYEAEAHVPRFFRGVEDALFMAKYFHDDRCERHDERLIAEVLEVARSKASENGGPFGESDFDTLVLGPGHVPALAGIYRLVFETYPFPIHDEEYLRRTMAENVVYFGVRDQGALVAVSSAEVDQEAQNAEMTDFATLPEHCGRGLATLLLSRMEQEVAADGVRTAYTIARALSLGMNATFAKSGYTYAGTLWNNTNISGGLESMNVWYRHLD